MARNNVSTTQFGSNGDPTPDPPEPPEHTMTVRFHMDGVADDRVFKNVIEVDTGEYEHGNEATVRQWFEGEIETFPVRGYSELTVSVDD